MGALTKAELVEGLFLELGFSKQESKALVNGFFDTIFSSLEQGHPLRLSSFGNFYLRDKNPRIGRNPKTMEDVEISCRRVVTFQAAIKLKQKLDNTLLDLRSEQ